MEAQQKEVRGVKHHRTTRSSEKGEFEANKGEWTQTKINDRSATLGEIKPAPNSLFQDFLGIFLPNGKDKLVFMLVEPCHG